MSFPGHSLQRCSQCILQPQPTGQCILWNILGSIWFLLYDLTLQYYELRCNISPLWLWTDTSLLWGNTLLLWTDISLLWIDISLLCCNAIMNWHFTLIYYKLKLPYYQLTFHYYTFIILCYELTLHHLSITWRAVKFGLDTDILTSFFWSLLSNIKGLPVFFLSKILSISSSSGWPGQRTLTFNDLW